MGRTLKTRLRALEGRTLPTPAGCVLTYDPEAGESADDALRRAPGPGGFLVVARPLTPAEWNQTAPQQQARLTRRGTQ